MTLSAAIKAARARLHNAHRDYMHAIRLRRAADKEAADARYLYHAAVASDDPARIRATLDVFTKATDRVHETAQAVDVRRVQVQESRMAITHAELADARTEGSE